MSTEQQFSEHSRNYVSWKWKLEFRNAEDFLAELREIADVYRLEGGAPTPSFLRFQNRWVQIGKAQAWVQAHAHEHESVAELCIGYGTVALHILRWGVQLLPLHQRVEWLQAALESARRLQKPQAETACLRGLGITYRELRNLAPSLQYLEQALKVARQINNRVEEAITLTELGSTCAVLRQTPRDLNCLEKAVRIYRTETEDRRGEAAALLHLGIARLRLRDFPLALDCFAQTLAIAQAMDKPELHLVEKALGNLGTAYRQMGDPRRAIEYHQQRLEIARQLGDPTSERNALGVLGNAFCDLEDLRTALTCHEGALKISCEILKAPGGEAIDCYNMGTVYRKMYQSSLALEKFARAQHLFRLCGDLAYAALSCRTIANIYQERGELHIALDYLLQAKSLCQSLPDQYDRGITFRDLAELLYELGQLPEALEASKTALLLLRDKGETADIMKLEDQLSRWSEEFSIFARNERTPTLPMTVETTH